MAYYAILRKKTIRRRLEFSDSADLYEKIKESSFFTEMDYFFFKKLLDVFNTTPSFEVSMRLLFDSYKIVLK